MKSESIVNLIFNVGMAVAFGFWMDSVAAGLFLGLFYIQTINIAVSLFK